MAKIDKVDIDQEVNFTGPMMKRVIRTIFIKLNEIIDVVNELSEPQVIESDDDDDDDDTPVSSNELSKGMKLFLKKKS